jgi:hypothetical protein
VTLTAMAKTRSFAVTQPYGRFWHIPAIVGRIVDGRTASAVHGLNPGTDQLSRRIQMTIRLLTITAVTLSVVSGTAYAGKPGWNQVTADAAARAYAAEGECYPANGPCPAPQPILHPYRTCPCAKL